MWFDKNGNDKDTVLSATAVIYRNIKGFPFEAKMSSADKEVVLGMVKQAVADTDKVFIRGNELDENMTRNLYEQRLITRRFIQDRDTNAVLLDKNDEGFAVEVNGIEHLVIRKSCAGSDIRSAYKKAEEVAVMLEKKLDIAFTEKMGFLTSGISVVGTGLFLGFSVAIPGVEVTAGGIATLAKRLEKYDWSIRPAFKNEKGITGGIYVLSGTATLGVSEKDVLRRAERVISDVIKFERNCRANIYKKKAGILQDQFCRSYGLLRYCRRIEKYEAVDLLGRIRLGLEKFDTEDINIDYDRINHISNLLMSEYEDPGNQGARSVRLSKIRSDMIRRTLKGDDKK